MRTYTVMPDDTLGGIAQRYYNDVRLYEQLAAYNGITDADSIYPGHILEIPAKFHMEPIREHALHDQTACKRVQCK